ncbi:MAG: hypothetical protein N3E40_02525 [Dehalococcoidia bacterium]|nr:hypothetical protein [Dehalococcoidia bacterium]
MTADWQKLVTELENETDRITTECPDEIKRFHYGLITHSEAGKRSFNQYFGHFVHLYGFYFSYSDFILPIMLGLAMDRRFNLEQLKEMFRRYAPVGPMAQYGGQKSLGAYAEKCVAALDSLNSKDDFIELLKAWTAYVSRLYWWVHWYFPWGIGPTVCRRLEPEDIKEILRLSKLDKESA